MKETQSGLKIIEDKKNFLFNRREIKGTINSEKVPSRKELLTALSSKFSVPSENIKINKISGAFGSKEFIFVVRIYNSLEEKNIFELKKKKENESEKKIQQTQDQESPKS